MSAININKNNFQNEVLNSDKPVLLDFWASWCAPSRMVVPIVEEIASERRDIKVGKINVDEEPELANKFSIMSIPTLISLRSSAISSTIGTTLRQGAHQDAQKSKRTVLSEFSTSFSKLFLFIKISNISCAKGEVNERSNCERKVFVLMLLHLGLQKLI